MRNALISVAFSLAFFMLVDAAQAHYGAPFVQRIGFPHNRPEATWLVIENVGLITITDTEFKWLCDEAITPLVGFNDLVPIDDNGEVWLAATRQGLYRTTNAGCAFTPVDGVLQNHVTHFLRPHPTRRNEILVATQTLAADLRNNVFISDDGGLTWRQSNITTQGRIRALHRAEANPEVVYAVYSDGAARSDDGGRTFQPLSLDHILMEEVSGTDFELLAIHPRRAQELYGAVVQFPESKFLRSKDGGRTWTNLLSVEDIPETLVFNDEGSKCLLSMPFEGLYLSEDGCETFESASTNLVQAWLSCLTRGSDNLIWACDRRSIDALVFSSDDFGLTWSPRFLADFSQESRAWDCPDTSPTKMVCATACDRSMDDCLEAPDGEIDDSPQSTAPTDMIDQGAGAEGHSDMPASGDLLGTNATPSDSGCTAALPVRYSPLPASLSIPFLLWMAFRRLR